MASVSPRRSKIPAEQRVFSLILALVASPQGLTKRDLLSSVYGYADRYRHGTVDAALERQFERDKDQVRALGIPIDTIDSPEESGNTQLTRYRISKSEMLIPADLKLSADELTLLRLASLAWAEGSLSVESRRAAMKLEALGAGVEMHHFGVAPSLGIIEPQAPALQRAIDAHRRVEFDYQLAGREAPLRRSVAPLHLHRADGRWHLIAYDVHRSENRVFLLSRIVGEVQISATRFDEQLFKQVPDVIAELHQLRNTQRVRLLVRTGSAAEARLSNRIIGDGHSETSQYASDETREILIETLDFAVLADEIAGYGSEVRVLEPASFRDQVRQLLETVALHHSDSEQEES